jgi:hypothetical protein
MIRRDSKTADCLVETIWMVGGKVQSSEKSKEHLRVMAGLTQMESWTRRVLKIPMVVPMVLNLVQNLNSVVPTEC